MRKNKEHLKQQIVNQKYFIENEPRFLTFAERQLICKLYKSNPEEWTVEKLSESFPALPETIRKIVHANWMPKSVERIMQYDDVAIENWKKFHTGKLPVSPRFNEHLKKFKNRKIILTDRELLAKQFVVPKPKFGKPKSQLFSNIIQSYASEKQNNEKLLQENNSHKMKDAFIHSNENQNLLIADNKTENNSIDVKNPKKFMLKEEQHLTLNSDTESKKHDIFNKKNNSEKLFTFDEFVKTKLEDIHKKSPKEDNLVDTSIKIWSKKIDAECDYAKPIKISENLYKPGMTYRINDCYYDDDGEFLYRIPGVQS
ncbi:hypothetical protein EAG_14169 [Camponotus floridanus]|uniref:Uncharacterized protein n=1 Tax=Camponotus floridanus TaxID=104421 RepID=E2AMB5_CAMFO|nr:hypothetical protein EAG_14169 [Camponotus floridanus]